jgi:hypothetical protein
MKALLKRWGLQSNTFVLLLSSSFVGAQSFQNIVPNGSFESYTLCPSNNSQIYRAAPWTGPRINSSDYFNSCSSIMNVPNYGGTTSPYPFYLPAKDGNAYAGIFYYKPTDDNREYAQVELSDTLMAGICYYVEFYAANSQGPPYAANNVAANLSATWYNTTTLSINNSILNITSHITNYGNPVLKDTVKWHKIAGIYEALGIEKYLIIGNFVSNAQTDTVRIFRPIGSANQAYLHLDAVSVYSIDPNGILPWSYRDTTINKGDSVYIGNKMGGLYFHPQWFTESGSYITTNAGITVSPTITSKYVVQFTLCGVQRTDTVKVTVPADIDVAVREMLMTDEALRLYPSPAASEIFIECPLIKDQEINIRLLMADGSTARHERVAFKSGKARIDVSRKEEGVYILEIRSREATLRRKVVLCRP